MLLPQDARSFPQASQARARGPGRRRLLVLGMAAVLIATAGLMRASRLWAQPGSPPAPVLGASLEAENQPMGNRDRLQKGVAEYNSRQYEEALATLQQVNPEALGESDRRTLADYLAKAESAANQRRQARAEFEKGEAALAAGNAAEAIAHYKAATGNRYVDDGTKAKCREQLAVADAMMKQAGQSLKDLYARAVADYKTGHLPDAKAKFEQLVAAEFKPGLFQKSPQDYLKDIDKRMPPPAAPVVAERVPTEPVAPAVVLEPPIALTAPTTEAAPVTEAEPPPPPAPEPPQVDPKAAYRLAREQYRSGDWIAARRNFELARDLGYRPGLFEDSPRKYLGRMDAKEQRDRQRAAELAAAQPAEKAAPTTEELALATEQAEQAARIEQQKAEAQKLVEQAEEARAANRWQEALALYTRAAELDPQNTAAQAGKSDLQSQLTQEAGKPDILTIREKQIEQQRQYIGYSFNTAIEDARKATAAGKFQEAQAAVERARVARASNPGVFRQEEIRQFDATIANTQTALDQAIEEDRIAQAKTARESAAAQLRQQQRQQDEERRRTIADLIRESRKLVDEAKYEQALGVIDQILKLDPNNDYGRTIRPLVEDRALVQEQRRYRESYDRNVVRHYIDAEEQKIPYSDILKFPENWPDLTATRDRSVAIERGERAEDAIVMQQLERKLPEVRFDNVGFADVIEFLRDVSTANIFVNWRALEAAGIDKNAPVSARLRDVKFTKALRTILDDVSGGTVRLGYTVDQGVITISTEEDLAGIVVTGVYDIRDLIFNITDFDDVPDFQIQGPQAGGTGGGGGGMFGGAGGTAEAAGGTRAELVDQIITLIQDTVATDSWVDNGGSIGSIRELAGQLIVRQTPENQQRIMELLGKLRETRAIQITVEARFLTVQRNFLEDIGVDFDMFIPSGELFSQVGPINIQTNTYTYTAAGSLVTAVPGNIATEINAASANPQPNFSTGFTFLDDFQVSVLLRATQIAKNSTILTAPRLTLFNGQRAWLAVSTQTAYVSDLTAIVGQSSVAFDPETGILESGVLLDVQATVSADRKYVTLTLRPVLSRLRELVSFPVTATATGTGDNANQITQTGFFQLPTMDQTRLRTTVSVPDGGTLLLGGQTLSAETERESGVPILSKIPFLKRLFTNTAMAKDDQVLLILVKPTIIIQREKEQQQFPLLGSRAGS